MTEARPRLGARERAPLRRDPRFETGYHMDIDRLRCQALNLLYLSVVAHTSERNGDAAAPGPARAADAMHVVFRHARHIEVDHMGDGQHVDAARRHVGCNQNLDVAAPHVAQGAIALALVHVAVQRRRREPLARQGIGDFIGRPLGGGKHDRLVDIDAAQVVIHEFHLVALVIGIVQALFDVLVAGLRIADLDALGVAGQLFRQLSHCAVEGRRKQHGLT